MTELERRLQATHPEYTRRLPEWTKARDFATGVNAMRAHDLALWAQGCASVIRDPSGMSRLPVSGAQFATIAQSAYILPTSDRMTYTEYVLYLLRGHCPSYVALTRSGYLGLIFSTPPLIELPPSCPLLDDADLQETPLVEFVEDVLAEVLTVGRHGVLLDTPPVNQPGITVAEAERMGLRPYAASYKAEDILDWRDARIGGRLVPVYYKLRERVRRGNGYDYDYRELVLEDGQYKQIFYTRANLDNDYSATETIPLKGGRPLDSIPFYMYSPRGGKRDIETPPLNDLIDLMHEYYQWAVEFANACFAVGIPTAAFFGFTDEEVQGITLGGLNGIHSVNENADAKYLEFTGQGLDALAARGVSILTNIAKFGGRMLTQDKAAAEAATTVRIRASAESATLADMARACSRITEQWLQFALDWGFGGGRAVFSLNTEYMDFAPDAQILAELRNQVNDNLYALGDLIRYQRRVNLISDSRTDEEIVAELEAQKEAAAEQANISAQSALANMATRLSK